MQPLVAIETMIPAAAIDGRAQLEIEHSLQRMRQRLKGMLTSFIHVALGSGAADVSDAELQRGLAAIRMRYNDMLNNFDLFADALSQRSERETGLWLAGLDVAAADALGLPGHPARPAVVCYLDRGPGAAIRRARTRLPGGGSNPVALVRVPRERMLGSGVATSLAHEAGHQAAALLGWVPALTERASLAAAGSPHEPWVLWQRWLSEIVADLWALSKLGPTATIGLLGVLSLPPHFVFRISPSDPHPPPWLRVKLSCALGRGLYPDRQWDELEALWDRLYSLEHAPRRLREPLERLAEAVVPFSRWLLGQPTPASGRSTLGERLYIPSRRPAALRALCSQPGFELRLPREVAPCHALAALGQARWLGKIDVATEGDQVAALLGHWAVQRALARHDPSRSDSKNSYQSNKREEYLYG
jgi:hypothetical protein